LERKVVRRCWSLAGAKRKRWPSGVLVIEFAVMSPSIVHDLPSGEPSTLN
jgi:hypothetical protein